MIVVDASALLEFLLQTPRAAGIARRLFAPGEQLHAPYLIDVEAAQVLRRYVLNGAIGAKRGRDALDDLDALPIHRWSHQFLLPRVWELRNTLTAYDAAYVALNAPADQRPTNGGGVGASCADRIGLMRPARDGVVELVPTSQH